MSRVTNTSPSTEVSRTLGRACSLRASQFTNVVFSFFIDKAGGWSSDGCRSMRWFSALGGWPGPTGDWGKIYRCVVFFTIGYLSFAQVSQFIIFISYKIFIFYFLNLNLILNLNFIFYPYSLCINIFVHKILIHIYIFLYTNF